jgi:hypothetical protein
MKLLAKHMQSNGLPFKSQVFAYYTGHFIPAPKGLKFKAKRSMGAPKI